MPDSDSVVTPTDRERFGPDRRRFLIGAGLVTGGALGGLGGLAAASSLADASPRPTATTDVRVVTAPEARRDGWYTPNRAPLAPTAFAKLPPGAVTAKGWVRGQLDLQLAGLNGGMHEISDYLVYDNCGWVHPDKVGWEELPYWLRGFSDLGLVTGDADVRALSAKWIDGILATQTDDGFFGPTSLRTSLEGGPDFWPSMPLLDLFRSHEEATGDERIVPFMTKFYGYMGKADDAVFGRSWAAARWGDTLDSIVWLYNRTGDDALLDLMTRIHENSLNWVDNVPSWHNVNVSQGFREPAQYAQLTKDQTLTQGTYRTYDTVMRRYGQFSGGGFAGDENARPGFGDPRQGFETCGIVEMMRSHEILTRITGDPTWADRCEHLAVNALPAAYDPQQKGVHYISSANSVALTNAGQAPDFQNGFAMQPFRPGLHIYRCCPHNYGQGWPYYTEEMWVATSDRGLCASLYGPNDVTAKVGDAGDAVTIAQDTDYPFDETVTLRVTSAKAVRFPLWLRVPVWCRNAAVAVNGAKQRVRPDGGSYVVLERTWQRGDTVQLTLPMTTEVQTWRSNHSSASVRRGPLTYSLQIGENYTTFTNDDDSIDDPDWPQYEVRPTTDWNVALASTSPHAIRVSDRRRVTANPFTHATAPITLTAPVRSLNGWRADDKDVVRPLQDSPVRAEMRKQTATLIPMAAARLRITSFPVAGDGGHEWEIPTTSHCFDGDLLDAVNDGLEPANSYDQTMPRLTFWDHLGTTEWVQYDYAQPIDTSSVAVYWYDDTGHGQCRVPASWRLLYRRNGVWSEVPRPSGYGTAADAWNRTTFGRVSTDAVRLEVSLQDGVSGGILEWRVGQHRA